jgi:hypothetical protein
MGDDGRALRVATVTTLGMVVAAAVALVVVIVSPGPHGSTCTPASGPLVSVGGRDYCVLHVALPSPAANYTTWSVAFHLRSLPTPGGLFLNATVVEPSGITFTGEVGCGILGNECRAWFTPDAVAGLNLTSDESPVALFVEVDH